MIPAVFFCFFCAVTFVDLGVKVDVGPFRETRVFFFFLSFLLTAFWLPVLVELMWS